MILQDGDILHCFSDELLSKAIRKVSDSKYSHTAMVIEIWGHLFVIDSQAKGTTLKTLDDWKNKYNYKYDISRPTNGITNEIRVRAVGKCGDTPYDFTSLIIFQPIYQLTGKWLGRKGKKSEKRMYCSELVCYVYSIPFAYSNAPQDVFDYCITHTYQFITIIKDTSTR